MSNYTETIKYDSNKETFLENLKTNFFLFFALPKIIKSNRWLGRYMNNI